MGAPPSWITNARRGPTSAGAGSVDVYASTLLDSDVVAAYQGTEAADHGEAFDPTPQNLEARIVRRTLANGLRDAFVIRYALGEQTALRIHHDVAQVSASIMRSQSAPFSSASWTRTSTRFGRRWDAAWSRSKAKRGARSNCDTPKGSTCRPSAARWN